LNCWVNTLNIDKYSMYVENLGWSNLSYCDDVLKLVDSPVTSPRSRSAVKRCRRSTYLQGSFRWCFRKTDSDGGIRSFRKKKESNEPRRVIRILVGGLEHFLFFHMWGIIIPTD
jgi:hypothetical protein